MNPLLIFPFNGNGFEALDCVSEFEFRGFVDDVREKQGKNETYGFSVYDRTAFTEFSDAKVLAVPGSPTSYKSREKTISDLGINTERFATVIHPSARISPRATIGKNVLIMAGVVITSNARIGDHVCILPNTVVHHDCIVSDYCLLGSNISIAGYTHIGKNCYIGSGSRIMNNLRIGDYSLIGLGSTVIRDVPPESKVVGNPARKIT